MNETNNYTDYLGKFFFLVSFVILGLMIFLFIQKPFLHIDEWFTRGLLNIPLLDLIHVTACDVHPPLYYITVWVPVNILNFLHIPYDMIFVMKMMSALPYIILYIIAFTKVRKDYGWLAGGLFAFMLLAMGNLFTVFSIARMYPLGTLILVCGFISVGEILKDSNTKNWIILTVCAILGAYTHYFLIISFAILYGFLFLHIYLRNRSQLKSWISSVICGALCYVPWALVLLKQLVVVHGDTFPIGDITFENVLEFFSSIFTASQDSIIQIVVILIFFVLFAMALKEYKKDPAENEFILLGLLVFVGTIVIGLVASVVYRPIVMVRYLTPSIGVALLAISIFISRYISKPNFSKFAIPIVIVILLFGAVNLYGQVDDISKNHETLLKNQEFLDSINNNDSVVIVTNMIKYVHFYDVLDNAIVYQGYSIGEREAAKDFARIYDNKNSTFFIPDDYDKYQNKTIYLVTPKSKAITDIRDNYTLEPVWKIDNSEFLLLKRSS